MPDTTPDATEAYASALLREREGYARHGRDDRVAEVDAELARLGVTPPGEPQRVKRTRKAKN